MCVCVCVCGWGGGGGGGAKNQPPRGLQNVALRAGSEFLKKASPIPNARTNRAGTAHHHRTVHSRRLLSQKKKNSQPQHRNPRFQGTERFLRVQQSSAAKKVDCCQPDSSEQTERTGEEEEAAAGRRRARDAGGENTQLEWRQYLETAAAAEAPAVLPGPAGGEETPIDLGGHGAVPARSAAATCFGYPLPNN
jgi:hypothetical protein